MKTVIAKMDTIYYDDDEAAEGDECEIRQEDNGRLVVSYEDGDEYVTYSGKGIDGHYTLTCTSHREKNGRASLHHMNNSRILEGFWIEDGWKGLWRIYLPKALNY